VPRRVWIAALVVLDPIAWAHDIGPTQITFSKVALVGVLAALLARRTTLAALRAPGSRSLVCGIFGIACITALTVIPATYLDAVARETLKALEYAYAFAFGVAAVAIASEGDEEIVRASGLLATALVCASALAEFVRGAPSGALIAGREIPRIAGFLEGRISSPDIWISQRRCSSRAFSRATGFGCRPEPYSRSPS
jgi:hypothetical protein